MTFIQSRAERVRRFSRLVVGLIIGGIALSGALTAWWNRLGAWGFLAAVVVGAVVLIAVLSMPERAWLRLTGAQPTEELGRLHEEGVRLRRGIPRLPDAGNAAKLDAYEAQLAAWAQRVYDSLPPRWRGVFLSDVPGPVLETTGFAQASRMDNTMSNRLQRLSEIMVAVGRSR